MNDNALCCHYSDDCPVCEDQAAIAAEFAVDPFEQKDASEAFAKFPPRFNERDCGGVFDGIGVVSDADPGL